MSKYLEAKQRIEALQAELQTLRAEEFGPTVTDIKARIAEFDIKPEDLFTAEQLQRKKAAAVRLRVPPKYALDGHTWGGKGAVPKWYTEAIASGKTPDEMLIRS